MSIIVMSAGLYFTKGEEAFYLWRWIDAIVFSLGLISIFVSDFAIVKGSSFSRIVLLIAVWFLAFSVLFYPAISNCLFVAFGVCAVAYAIWNKRIYPISYAFIIVFIYGLLQTLGTIGTPKGFRFEHNTTFLFVIPLVFICFSISKEELLIAFRWVVKTILLYLLCSLFYWLHYLDYFQANAWQWLTSKMVLGGHSVFVYVAGWSGYYFPTFVCLIPLVTLSIAFYSYRHKSISWVLLLVYWVATLWFCMALESRVAVATCIGITVLSIVAYLWYKISYRKLYLVVCFLALLVAGFALKDKLVVFCRDSARVQVYTLATNYISEHILWGCGSGEQEQALLEEEVKMGDNYQHIPVLPAYSHSHNQFLDEFMQFGVVGFLVVLLLFVVGFYMAFKHKNYLMFMLFFIFIVNSMIDVPFNTAYGQNVFIVFFCLFSQIPRMSNLVEK